MKKKEEKKDSVGFICDNAHASLEKERKISQLNYYECQVGIQALDAVNSFSSGLMQWNSITRTIKIIHKLSRSMLFNGTTAISLLIHKSERAFKHIFYNFRLNAKLLFAFCHISP